MLFGMPANAVADLLTHGLVRLRHESVMREVAACFSDWLPDTVMAALLYSLGPFAAIRPLCYFDEEALVTSLAILEANADAAFDSLSTQSSSVTHAILTLLRGTAGALSEHPLSIQTPKQIVEIEQTWHPNYQRLIEHVYNNLLSVVLETKGTIDRKQYVDQTLGNRIQLLRDMNLPELAEGASATIRNAISHGGVRFGHDSITYGSNNNTERLTPWQLTHYVDRLADVSSALAVSLLLFLCRNPQGLRRRGASCLPLGIRFLLIRGLTLYRGFTLQSISESEIRGKSVVNLYASSGTRSRMVHRYDGLCCAFRALEAGCENHWQISVSIDCGGPVPTFTAHKVDEMKAALAPGASPALLSKVIDYGRDLLWYDVSSLARRIYSLRCSISETFRNARQALTDSLRQSGLPVIRSRYRLRFDPLAGNKSVGRIRRAEGHAVIRRSENPTDELLERIARHATRRLRWRLLRSYDMTGKGSTLARRPGYVWIKIHRTDARFRELDARQTADPHVLAESEWTSRRYRSRPITLKRIDPKRGLRFRAS